MTEFEIRKMNDADWPEISRIYQEGIDTNIATFQTESPSWKDWDAAHIKECRLVVTLNGKAVGWTALSRVSQRSVYSGVAEVSIYIAKEQRKKGAGRLLLRELIRKSEENGFWMLQSGIIQENAASIRLHESCGFRMVGYRERIGRDRFGVWRNTVLMERRSARAPF